MDDYFKGSMAQRTVMSWACATRVQLDRWETLQAAWQRSSRAKETQDSRLIWQAQFEHHFCLIAAAHFLRSTDVMLDPPLKGGVDPIVRAELIEARDLHEHWVENMPIFNRRPRQSTPSHKTGKEFAKRNPTAGPYFWLRWNSKQGPMLTPNVPAAALHEVIDRAQKRMLDEQPGLSDFVPARLPSPWIASRDTDGWWPLASPFTASDGEAIFAIVTD